MFNGVQGEKFTGLAAAYVTELGKETMESYQAIYACNQHRVYALAFWMTDNELRPNRSWSGHSFVFSPPPVRRPRKWSIALCWRKSGNWYP